MGKRIRDSQWGDARRGLASPAKVGDVMVKVMGIGLVQADKRIGGGILQ